MTVIIMSGMRGMRKDVFTLLNKGKLSLNHKNKNAKQKIICKYFKTLDNLSRTITFETWTPKTKLIPHHPQENKSKSDENSFLDEYNLG